ncbi:MAG: hypothetical protein RBS43_09025 [Candidatus Cloacimonas sp.]|jgi:hypothetical protein|nr:hypothetical protein [Candidatus Cloacimonas sp.]
MNKIFLATVAILVMVLALSAQVNPEYKPGDQSLMLVPTAYTMPSGSNAITNYEVVFIQYAHSFTNHTHLSIASMMPITSDFVQTITLGVKQRYLVQGIVQSTVFGSFTPDNRMLIVGNVVSLGKPSTSLHLGLAYGSEEGNAFDAPIFYLGARKDFSHKVALLIEYGNSTTPINGAVKGIASMCFRFIGDTISWDLGGVRPVGIDMGNLNFFPVLKATFEF